MITLRIIRKILKWILIVFFGSTVLAVAAFRFIPVYVTPLMIIRAINPQGSEMQRESERHWKHRWISLDDMSQWMPAAVVASEDGNFYEHKGFDFDQIEKAMEERREGKRERGASTISQQTA